MNYLQVCPSSSLQDFSPPWEVYLSHRKHGTVHLNLISTQWACRHNSVINRNNHCLFSTQFWVDLHKVNVRSSIHMTFRCAFVICFFCFCFCCCFVFRFLLFTLIISQVWIAFFLCIFQGWACIERNFSNWKSLH